MSLRGVFLSEEGLRHKQKQDPYINKNQKVKKLKVFEKKPNINALDYYFYIR